MMRTLFDRSLKPRVSKHSTAISFGPFFNSSTQKRWRKKPASTAKTRLQDTRVKDSHFDRLSSALKKLNIVLKYHEIVTANISNIGPFSSVQIISVWKRRVGLTGKVGAFLRKYPHVFDVFPHPVRRSLCCRLTDEVSKLIAEEEKAVKESECETVERLKRFLMMTVDGKVSVHTLFHVRREMGLGRDFVNSILAKYNDVFELDVENGTVELVVAEGGEKEEVFAAVEVWREREYREKWLSALETEFAFPLNFPNGFKKPPGFRDMIKNWQRLPYRKPYDQRKKERRGKTRVESGSRKRYEKRAVSLIHEFLSLTVEKMVEAERLTRLRKDFGMLVNVREVLLRHPGIFYVSTRGFTLRVFLREAYSRGVLLEPNPVHFARRKMLDLMMTPRHRLEVEHEGGVEEGRVLLEKEILASHEAERRGAKKDKDWVLPMLETLKDS